MTELVSNVKKQQQLFKTQIKLPGTLLFSTWVTENLLVCSFLLCEFKNSH